MGSKYNKRDCMQRFSAFVMGCAVCASAVASSECTTVQDDKARLACYDLKYRPTTVAAKISEWRVQESSSKMDDSKTVVLQVESEERVPGQYGGAGVTADLYLRCSENTTSVYFILGDNFLADVEGYGDVTYRLDAQKPKTASMDASTDNKALGLWSGGYSIPFIKGIFGHSAMVVRITPFNQSPMTVTFPVSGLEGAIAPLRKACGW